MRLLTLALLGALSCTPNPNTPTLQPASEPSDQVSHRMLPGQDTNKTVRFALLGDLAERAERGPSEATRAVIQALSQEDSLDFAILLGDSLLSLDRGELLGHLIDVPGDLLSAFGEQEYGNHSLRQLLAVEKIFRAGVKKLPPPFPERSLEAEEFFRVSPDPLGRWYSIRQGQVLVVVLDSEARDDEGFAEQVEYLKEVIRLAELPRSGVDIKHIFIVIHKPFFSTYTKNDTRIQNTLGPIWATSTKVRGIFSAHARTYERYALTRTRDGVPLPDVLYAVLGTGGAPNANGKPGALPDLSYGSLGGPDGLIRVLGTSSYADFENGPPSAKNPIYGYGIVEISPQGDVKYRFVPVAVDGGTSWAGDSCEYGGGLIRWQCQ